MLKLEVVSLFGCCAMVLPKVEKVEGRTDADADFKFDGFFKGVLVLAYWWFLVCGELR